jgi:hypothetical protein
LSGEGIDQSIAGPASTAGRCVLNYFGIVGLCVCTQRFRAVGTLAIAFLPNALIGNAGLA